MSTSGQEGAAQPPHKRNQRVTVHWPGGPYDFTILFRYAEPATMPGWEDWLVIHGLVIEPEGPEHRAARSFYVHPVEDGYALLPMRKD